MTTAQKTQAMTALEELKTLKPNVKWAMTWNYYTKLPEFQAIKDGGVSFSMFTRERREIVTQDNGIKYPRYTGEKYTQLEATHDPTTRDNGNGMIVSGAHDFDKLPRPTVKQEIPRKNFKAYIQFVKDNLGILEAIGA